MEIDHSKQDNFFCWKGKHLIQALARGMVQENNRAWWTASDEKKRRSEAMLITLAAKDLLTGWAWRDNKLVGVSEKCVMNRSTNIQMIVLYIGIEKSFQKRQRRKKCWNLGCGQVLFCGTQTKSNTCSSKANLNETVWRKFRTYKFFKTVNDKNQISHKHLKSGMLRMNIPFYKN